MEKGIIFMGTPEFALPVLRSLIESPYHVLAAYTQPDKSAGRGQRVGLSPVKRLAMEYEIPVIQPQTLKSAEVMQGLADFAPDLIVVAAFGHILPAQVLSLPRFACLNIHPSLLPAHRGPSPIADAILCGDPITGVTIILMDEGMDTGPIVAQREMDISDVDTTGSLAQKLSHAGAQLLLETLPGWFDGRFEPQPQDEARASYSTLLTNKDSQLDWHLAAEELWRRIRAFNPWPGCYTWWKGKRLKIRSAAPAGKAAGRVGQVVALPKSSPVRVGVVTGEGVLGLCQVQLEGKREMPIDEFIRGQRDFVGSVLS